MLMIINFFIVITVIGGPASGVATQNFGGSKCLTSGKQQHFCLGRRFSKHKMTRYDKICNSWPPELLLTTPMEFFYLA